MTEALYQASCVARMDRALIIEGPSGSGKSSLALALIDRGWTLVGDDGVALAIRDGRIWASPPANIAGLLEIRNLGLVKFPTTSSAVSLVIRLDPDAPRFRDAADETTLLGQPVPLISLWPGTPDIHLKAEWALSLYGIA